MEDKYTGQISVSAYHVSYILPKEFLRRETDPRSKRPSTIAQFMAAIDMWVPFISQPPHAPYLVSSFIPNALALFISDLCLQAFHPGTSMLVQPHQAEDIPSTYTQNLVISRLSLFGRRRREFLGSDIRSPCYAEPVSTLVAFAFLQQLC